MNKNDIDSFFILNVIANILQIANYNMSVKEANNDNITKMLEIQNQKYLDIIKKDIKDIKDKMEEK